MREHPSLPWLVTVGVFTALVVLASGAAHAEDGDYPHGDWDGDCENCHSDVAFKPAQFAPSFRKEHPFPLRAAHDLPRCESCHQTLEFSRADPACDSCHLNPHRTELGPDCGQCHVARNWIDRSRMQRRHQRSLFPLRGSHRALACEQCHPVVNSGELRFVGTPVDCFACHRTQYEATADPDHLAEGYPTTCDSCHPVTVWEAGRFDHSGIVSGCVNCHLDDYNATSDPDHQQVGFPTTCEQCHTTSSWDNAVFGDHDAKFFPIYSGTHRNRWSSCNDCHINNGNFSAVSCLTCHSRSDMNEEHDDVSGYVYSTPACLSCHPDGRAP